MTENRILNVRKIPRRVVLPDSVFILSPQAPRLGPRCRCARWSKWRSATAARCGWHRPTCRGPRLLCLRPATPLFLPFPLGRDFLPSLRSVTRATCRPSGTAQCSPWSSVCPSFDTFRRQEPALNLHSSVSKTHRNRWLLDASTDYIELDMVDRESAAARQQQDDAARLVNIEQQRAEAGVDPLSQLLQAQLTAAEIKLKRSAPGDARRHAGQADFRLTALPVASILPDHASIPEIPAVSGDPPPRISP